MAIIAYHPRLRKILAHLFEASLAPMPKIRRGTKRSRARKVFRFHKTHRQTAGNNGPGRKAVSRRLGRNIK